MSSTLEKLKELFFVRVKPVTSLDNPNELAKGEAGFHFAQRVWVLRDPDTGEFVVPNKNEADISIIVDKLDGTNFYAEGLRDILFFSSVEQIDPVYTLSTITLNNLKTTLPNKSVTYLEIPATNNMNGLLPTAFGGLLKILKFNNVLLFEFDGLDGNKQIAQVSDEDIIQWRQSSDFDSIVRTDVDTLGRGIAVKAPTGAINFIAKGITARRNVLKGAKFETFDDWSITGATLIEKTEDYVEFVMTAPDVIFSQTTNFLWRSYSRMVAFASVYMNTAATLSIHINDGTKAVTKTAYLNRWTNMEFDSTSSTIADNTLVDFSLKISTMNWFETRFRISLKTPILLNSLYGTGLLFNNQIDYNPDYNAKSSKVSLKTVGTNKFNKYDVLTGFRLDVDGNYVEDPLYFVSKQMTVGKGFTIIGADSVQWEGIVAGVVTRGTSLQEKDLVFEPKSFIISGLLSDISNIMVVSADVVNPAFSKYTERSVNVDIELRGISNGTSYHYDELFTMSEDGKPDKVIHIKRVSNAKPINTNVLSLSNGINNQYITVPLSQFEGLPAQTTGLDNSFFISGIDNESSGGISTNGSVYTWETTTNNLMIAFPTGTFISEADAKQKVSTYVLFHKIEPVITELSLVNLLVPANPSIENNYVVRPFMQYTLPENTGASYQDISEKVTELSQIFNNLEELNFGGGGSGGPLYEKFNVTLSKPETSFDISLQEYDPATDLLVVFRNDTLMTLDVDYKIDTTLLPMKLVKIVPETGVPSDVPWDTGTKFRAIAILTNGVTDKHVIPKVYQSTFHTVESTNKVPIEIAIFNNYDQDILFVDQDNFVIHENVNYTIKNGLVVHNGVEYTGWYIELIDYMCDGDTIFHFKVLKAVRSADPIGEIDPTLIRKGIGNDQLDESIEIGSVFELSTDAKKVVPAINELAQTKLNKSDPLPKTFPIQHQSDMASYPMVTGFKDTGSYPIGSHVIAVGLPFGFCNTTMSMNLRIKSDINNNSIYTINIAGTLKDVTDKWEGMSVMIDGVYNTVNVVFTVINGKCNVLIGDDNSFWDKPFVIVEDLMVFGDQVLGWNENWNIRMLPVADIVAGDLEYVKPVLGWSSEKQEVINV